MSRSEDNKVGNSVFTDLSMTHYPSKIDSRVVADPGYNPNMKGFTNLSDYNMAEHVNALADAVMAIERILGIRPQIDKDGQDKGTVGVRLTTLENKDYDARYGGAGWDASQTLVGHTHTGTVGHPSKINLVSEVQGKMNVVNINTDGSTGGITGEDISISGQINTRLSEAINDKLSVSEGGTIQKNLDIKGALKTRTHAEYDANYAIGGSVVSDNTTASGKSVYITGTSGGAFLSVKTKLLFGKYVVIVRLKVSSLSTETVVRITCSNNLSSGVVTRGVMDIKGSDFDKVDTWQNFYLVVENQGDIPTTLLTTAVDKTNVTTANKVDFDYCVMTPVHPAIYDK